MSLEVAIVIGAFFQLGCANTSTVITSLGITRSRIMTGGCLIIALLLTYIK